MYSWLDDLLLLAVGALLILIVILTNGCTAQTREQQAAAAAAAAIEGYYVDGIGCKRLRTATGRAAVKAAASNAERQIEVRR